MTIQDALHQIENAGGFARAAAGDQAAANYVVRYAAYLANPSGDTSSWGWLTKSGGEGGVDADGGGRFAEDALVLGADPNNTNNVYDFVGGTGAPGARILYGATPVQRRSSNQWAAPRPLSAREMAYIGLSGGSEGGGNGGGGNGGGTGGGGTTPTQCNFQPVDLGPVLRAIVSDHGEIIEMRNEIDALRDELSSVKDDVAQVKALLSNIDARLQQGLTIDASVPVLGRIRGTIKG